MNRPDWEMWILQKNLENLVEELEKTKPSIKYSVKLHEKHAPSREDINQDGHGATYKVHALSDKSPKVDDSNHVGNIHVSADGLVEDSDFHSSVPKDKHTLLYNYVQSNHHKLVKTSKKK